MRYDKHVDMRTLGRTGVKVSPLCLGAMMFGEWGNPDHDDCVRIIHRALDAGINFIDTADVYSAGESEEIVGKALRGRRDDVVLATKAVIVPMGDDPNRCGATRGAGSRCEVENSLRRLGTDWIDLYQIHRPTRRPTSTRPSARSPTWSGGQDPLPRQLDLPGFGHRRGAVGGRAARTRALRLRAAAVLDPGARHRGRRPARLPERYGMGVIPWSPLAGGWLTGLLPQGSGRADDQPQRRARPAATTCPTRRTSASSRPSSSWRCWPRKRACR